MESYERITVSLSKETIAHYQEQAERHTESLSAYIRRVLVDAQLQVAAWENDAAVMAEARRRIDAICGPDPRAELDLG